MHLKEIFCFKAVVEAKMNFQPLPDLPLLSVDILCGTLNQVSCIPVNPVALERKVLKRIMVTLILHRRAFNATHVLLFKFKWY